MRKVGQRLRPYKCRLLVSFSRNPETFTLKLRRRTCFPSQSPHFRPWAVQNRVCFGQRTRSIFDRYDIVNQGDLNDVARKLDERIVTKTVRVLIRF